MPNFSGDNCLLIEYESSLKLELLLRKVWNPCRFFSQVIENAHNFLGTNCILEFKRPLSFL